MLWKIWKIDFSAPNILCSEYHEISMLRVSAPNIMKYTNIDLRLCALLSAPSLRTSGTILPWCLSSDAKLFTKALEEQYFLFSSYHICFRNQNTSMLQIILNLQFYINLHFSPALKGFRDSGTKENAIKIVENWS